MGTATIRDLRYRFPEVERRLQAGETIEITKRGRPVGRLSPLPHDDARRVGELPDFLGRMKSIFGDKVFTPSNAELMRRDRDRD